VPRELKLGHCSEALERDVAAVRAALAAADTGRQAVGALWAAALVAEEAGVPALAPGEAAPRLESWLSAHLAASRAESAGLSDR
jgi:hypothetical protein